MKNTNPNLIFYMGSTCEVALIHKDELGCSFTPVYLKGINDPVWMNVNDLEGNMDGLYHPPFEGRTKQDVEFIHYSLRNVNYKTYEQWEDGFRRYVHPDQKIQKWM